MTICERLFDFMEKEKIPQNALANGLNITPSTVNNWKTRGTNPPAELIVPICVFLGMDACFLLTGEKKSPAINEGWSDADQKAWDYYADLHEDERAIVLAKIIELRRGQEKR